MKIQGFIFYTSDMQAMMWGVPDLAGTAVDLGNDANITNDKVDLQ